MARERRWMKLDTQTRGRKKRSPSAGGTNEEDKPSKEYFTHA